MKWNSKTDVIAIILSIISFPLIVMLAGIIAPTIINIKHGGLDAIVTIILLLTLIYFATFFLISRSRKHRKTKENQ